MATPFLNLLGSQPAATGAAASEVGVAATNINNLAGVIKSVMSIADWKGASKDGQQGQLGEFMKLFQQLLTSMTQIQTTATAGATQIQASKLATEATVTAAQSGRYVVLPTGNVQPGPWHYAFASTHPGSMGVFRGIASMLTAHIHASVGQSKAVDTQVAAAIAQVALDYLGGWLDEKFFPSSAGAGTIPTTVTPGTLPGTLPGTTPGTLPGTLPGGGVTPAVVTAPSTDPSLAGTTLAGAGGLGAASLGGAGPQLGGAGGLGGINGPLGGAGLMLGGGAAGAVTGGVIGATGGAAARGGAGATPMMPMGGGAHGAGGDGRQGTSTDLTEDEKPWDQGDAPDAVLR